MQLTSGNARAVVAANADEYLAQKRLLFLAASGNVCVQVEQFNLSVLSNWKKSCRVTKLAANIKQVWRIDVWRLN